KYTVQRNIEAQDFTLSKNNINELVKRYTLPSQVDLFYQVTIKNIDLRDPKEVKVILDCIESPKPVKIHEPKPEYVPSQNKKDAELVIFGESSDRIVYNLANCCKPIPGDDVFGFVTTGKGLTIHRTNCPNATKLLSNYGH